MGQILCNSQSNSAAVHEHDFFRKPNPRMIFGCGQPCNESLMGPNFPQRRRPQPSNGMGDRSVSLSCDRYSLQFNCENFAQIFFIVITNRRFYCFLFLLLLSIYKQPILLKKFSQAEHASLGITKTSAQLSIYLPARPNLIYSFFSQGNEPDNPLDSSFKQSPIVSGAGRKLRLDYQ